ncbi:MAG: response regulator [Chthoniobacteraceae bacterium]
MRAVPAPITHLPVNALTDTIDPTREIRSLIEHLQISARDARLNALALEHEKDELSSQLESALLQIDQLRSNEREIRSQFVEITSVIRERDVSLQEADRLRRIVAETQRQCEAAIRERNDTQRQRDDLLRRQAEETRSEQQAMAQLAEAQKQTACLRQARDASNNHNLELTTKLSRFEDDFAELGYQRDAAQKTQKQLHAELLDLRRQIGLITSDRDATDAQVQDLMRQLDEARRRALENAGPHEADSEAVKALASVTFERDAARTRTQELTVEMDVMRIQVSELRDQANLPNVPLQAHEDLLRQLASITGERETLAARERHLAEEVESQQQHLTELIEHLAAAQQEREQAHHALGAGQQQFEQELHARERKRVEEAEHFVEVETRLEALRMQNVSLEENLAAANRRVLELSQAQNETRLLAARFEKQRLATIDLGTRFEAAQREIVELSANLAEARLAARFANSRAAKEAAAAIKDQLLPAVDSSALAANESIANMEACMGERAQPLSPEISETLGEKEARSAVSAMRRCFSAFQKDTNDISLLNELYSHVYGFSERTRVSGYVALHRLSGTFAHLVHELYEFPEMLNTSTMRTIAATIDFLITLTKDRNVAQIKDPAKALVYVVDDDPDNCDAIKMSMATTMLRATCAGEPSTALAQLTTARFNLIFLDVNLPEMDGFELCSRIRALPGYAKTPVIFLTGMTSLETRVQSSLNGACEFIGKPFNLHELTVKALTAILKTELLMD